MANEVEILPRKRDDSMGLEYSQLNLLIRFKFVSHDAIFPSEPGLPQYRGFTINTQTHHTW